MAVVQDTTIDKKAGSQIAQEDAQGYYYTPGVGDTRIYSGAGSPHGTIGSTANPVPLGSKYINRTTGEWYKKSSSTTNTTWTIVSSAI